MTSEYELVTVRIDTLVESLQNLLVNKAGECRRMTDEYKRLPSQAWSEQRAEQLFAEYASGVIDCAAQLDDENLGGIVRAFASVEKAALRDERAEQRGRI